MSILNSSICIDCLLISLFPSLFYTLLKSFSQPRCTVNRMANPLTNKPTHTYFQKNYCGQICATSFFNHFNFHNLPKQCFYYVCTFLLNGFSLPTDTMTLLRADCLTPIQLSFRSKCYLYSYHSAMVISQDIWI